MREVIKNCYVVAFPAVSSFRGKAYFDREKEFVKMAKETFLSILSSQQFDGTDAKIEITNPRCLYCFANASEFESDESIKEFNSLKWADEVIANSKTPEGVEIIKKAYAEWRVAEGLDGLSQASRGLGSYTK